MADDQTPLERMIGERKSRFLPGGPPVDCPVLCAYVAGTLTGDERKAVAERITTWWDWYEEYLVLLDADGTDREDDDVTADATRAPESSTGRVPASLWLQVPLPVQSAVAPARTWATRVAGAFCENGRMVVGGGRRGDPSQATIASPEQLIESELTNKKSISLYGDPARWISIKVDGGDVVLRAGASPAELLDAFSIEFRKEGHSVLSVEADAGAVRLTPDHFRVAAESQADELAILDESAPAVA